MGELPVTLDMARAELQKLKDASLSEGDPSHQLRKELAVVSLYLYLIKFLSASSCISLIVGS